MKFDLRDGRRIKIRAIQASDRVHLEHGLTCLSAETRRLRFHGERVRFTAAELEYLTTCDGVDRIAVVAIGLDEADEEWVGVGVARAYRAPEGADRAEMAIVVIDDWQRVGTGRRLLDALAERCRSVGIHEWTAHVLGENETAYQLLASYGPVIGRTWSGGSQEISVRIA